MTALALATIDDLEARPGVGPIRGADNLARARALLADVSVLARAAAGYDWIDESGNLEEVPDAVVTIVAIAAARVWRNPNALVQETAGPFSRSFGSAAADGIYFTEAERKTLAKLGAKAAGRSTHGLWTLTLTDGAAELHDDLRPVSNGGDPLPMFRAEGPFE